MQDKEDLRTISGIPVKKIYTAEDVKDVSGNGLGMPGSPPYTRGTYPNMYRERLWRIFQMTGHGTTEDTAERIRYALEQGSTGFAPECDIQAWLLYDVDHPSVLERKDDVGIFGAPMMSFRDYEAMHEGVEVGRVFSHYGAPLPQCTPFALSCYLLLMEKRGIPINEAMATGEGDFFMAYICMLVDDFIPPSAGLRLNCDAIEYCTKNARRITPVSIPGNNLRESGFNGYQEVAIIFANAIAYIEELLGRGHLQIDDFAHAIGGINLSVGRDFFEDIAKMRAARRMWYKLLKEKYQAQNPRSMQLRIHGLTQGSVCTYQQPLNNIVRCTYQALAAALAGCQSIGVNSYDEAISSPSLAAHTVALRTHQVLQFESNITNTIDPLGGSYYVEWLTDQMEERAWDYLEKINNEGGFIEALNSGWLQREAVKGALELDRSIKKGDLKVVGVNCFVMEEEPHKVEVQHKNPNTWEIAMARLEQLRRERDSAEVGEALKELRQALAGDQNTIPATIKAVRAGSTIGEIGSLYREVFGTWQSNVRF